MGAYLGVVAYPGHYGTQIDQHKEVNIMCLSYCIFITIPIHYSGYYNNWSSLEQMQHQIKTNDHDHEMIMYRKKPIILENNTSQHRANIECTNIELKLP